MKIFVKKYMVDLLFVLGIIICGTVIIVQSYGTGLHFDEVNRFNTLFEMFVPGASKNISSNALWSIYIHGIEIPIMYKEYISALLMFRNLPLVFASNPYLAIKTIHIIYFLIEVSSIYIFARKRHKWGAWWLSLLLMSCPLVYPDVVYGFAGNFHIIICVLVAFWSYQYYIKKKRRYLFGAAFILGLGANFSFYFIWIALASIVVSFVLHFGLWKEILKSIRNLACLIAGVGIGLINFILYNVFNKFPTVRVFLDNIFRSEEFRMDGVSGGSFSEKIATKYGRLDFLLGGHLKYYVILFGIMVIIWLIITWLYLKKKIDYNKIIFYPILILIITILEITISPNIRFSYHWQNLSPMWELSLILGIVILYRYFCSDHNIYGRTILVLLAAMSVLFNVTFSREKILEQRIAPGREYVSAALLDLHSYLYDMDIAAPEVLIIQWGMDAQLYFLNRGIDSDFTRIYYRLYGMSVEQVKETLGEQLMNNVQWYVPVYTQSNTSLNYNNVRQGFIELLDECGITYDVENVFYDRSGEERIILYKISDDKISDKIRGE